MAAAASDDEFADAEDNDELTKKFQAASNHLRSLTDVTDSATLLYLYSRYKQATDGPCNVPKPGLFDFRGKQKWETWKSLGGMDRKRAMAEYVEKIEEIDPEWKMGEKSGKRGKTGGGFGVGVSRMVAEKEENGGSEWMDAIKEGQLERVKALLPGNSSLVNCPDETGMTALHWAADRGHLDLLEYLIRSAHANVNAQDENGQTPLHYTYACGHEKLVEALLAAGADDQIRDTDGKRPHELDEG